MNLAMQSTGKERQRGGSNACTFSSSAHEQQQLEAKTPPDTFPQSTVSLIIHCFFSVLHGDSEFLMSISVEHETLTNGTFHLRCGESAGTNLRRIALSLPDLLKESLLLFSSHGLEQSIETSPTAVHG